MTDQTLIEELEADYANKMADLLLGKNLGEHYNETSAIVKQINALLDTGKLIEEEIAAFRQLGFLYYRLRDQILDEVMK